ncbi:hypothetical protein CSKR_100729 [Clonorchis sinensis]|uniref:Uncharacterized protein n=1 Tax=Clonorchis sinensis TaxID=79923 RepID=A0A3R7EQG0_CLOSI|nr:hypothetical protein CSKR_100729 [Clonorchis sinensis]
MRSSSQQCQLILPQQQRAALDHQFAGVKHTVKCEAELFRLLNVVCITNTSDPRGAMSFAYSVCRSECPGSISTSWALEPSTGKHTYKDQKLKRGQTVLNGLQALVNAGTLRAHTSGTSRPSYIVRCESHWQDRTVDQLEHEAAWCSTFSCLKSSQTRDSAGFQWHLKKSIGGRKRSFLDASKLLNNRSAVESLRCLTAMPPEESTRAGILPNCPSLDRGIIRALTGEPSAPSFLLNNTGSFTYLCVSCNISRRHFYSTPLTASFSPDVLSSVNAEDKRRKSKQCEAAEQPTQWAKFKIDQWNNTYIAFSLQNNSDAKCRTS